MKIAIALACVTACWAITSTVEAQPLNATHETAAASAADTRLALLSYDEALSRTLEASPLLRAGSFGIDAATASIDQAGTRPNPEIGVEVENFTGTGPYSQFGSTETTISYSQRLERGGKRAARVALAQADRDVAKLDMDRTKLDVENSVRQAWITMLQAAAEVRNAEQRVTLASEIGDIVRRRVKAARDPIAAGLRADNQVAEARTELERAQHSLETAKRSLASLWGGRDADFSFDDREFYDFNRSYPRLAGEVPSEVVPADIAILLAEAQRASRSYELEKTKTKQDPSIGVGIRRFENGNDFAGIVSFSIPLALYDTNRGNINRAMAEKQQAEWLLAEGRRRFSAELQRQLGEFNAAKAEATSVSNDLVPRAQAAIESLRDGYNRGAFSYTEVSDAERSLVDLRDRENAALLRLHQASAAIDRLVAGAVLAEAGKERGNE